MLQKLIDIIKKAGKFQLEHFRTMPPGAGDEKALREMVSFVDVETEKLLISELEQLIPNAGFFGEETGRHGNQNLEWIIDPLDGTTNFLSGLDQFSISVALVENGTPTLAVVHRPVSGEIFSAEKGEGFYHNEKKCIKISENFTLSQALIGTGFPYRSPDLQKQFFGCAGEVLNNSRGIRRMGSAALDLSYTAAGFLQGFWESELQPYDVAATILFLNEMGYSVTNEKGKSYDMFTDRVIVAAPPSVHKELLPIVKKHYVSS